MPWNSEAFRYSRAFMLLNGPAIQRNCSGYRDLEIIFSLLERMSFSNCLAIRLNLTFHSVFSSISFSIFSSFSRKYFIPQIRN